MNKRILAGIAIVLLLGLAMNVGPVQADEPSPDTPGAWIIYPDSTPDHWVGDDRYSGMYGSDVHSSIHEALGYSGALLCPGDPGHDGGDVCHWENYNPPPEGSIIELRGPGLWDIAGHPGECGGPGGCGTEKQKSLVVQQSGITIRGQDYDDGTGTMVQQEIFFNNGSASTALFYLEASDLTIENLHINSAWGSGVLSGYALAIGRYYQIGPDPHATGLTVSGNTFTSLRAMFDERPTVADLTVVDNYVEHTAYNIFKKGVTFTGENVISGNSFNHLAEGSGYPAIQVLGHTGTTCIDNNIFNDWRSGQYAVRVDAPLDTPIGIGDNNTFADQLGGSGAGYELYPLTSGGHAVGAPSADDITGCAPANEPPVADPNGPYSGDEGSAILLDGTGSSDPDGDPLTYSWSVDSGLCSFDDATSPTPYLTCTDNGDFIVTLEVDDGQATDSDTAPVTVSNVAPSVSIDNVSPTLLAVGESVTADGSFTDPGTNDTHTAEWDWGDTATSAGSVSGLNVGPDSHTYTAPGIYTVKLTVTDDDGGVGMAEFEFVVVYDPDGGFVTGGGWIDSPYGALRLPTDPPFFEGSYYELVEDPYLSWAEANTAANAAILEGCEYPHLVTITSQDEQDALYEFFDGDLEGKWYGGFQDEGVTDPAAGWNWVTGELWDYTNWAPGEPNDAYGPGSEPHLIGWLNGWAWNDEGNLDNVTGYVVEYEKCGPTGKATFGFVSKYKKGADKPTGNTEFQFHAAGLNFHSDSYEWLVVTGSNYARFKGSGTINGGLAPNGQEYRFMVWAGDDDPDTFRIKIWWEENDTEHLVYDNGFNQAIGGGSIVIHTKK